MRLITKKTTLIGIILFTLANLWAEDLSLAKLNLKIQNNTKYALEITIRDTLTKSDTKFSAKPGETNSSIELKTMEGRSVAGSTIHGVAPFVEALTGTGNNQGIVFEKDSFSPKGYTVIKANDSAPWITKGGSVGHQTFTVKDNNQKQDSIKVDWEAKDSGLVLMLSQ